MDYKLKFYYWEGIVMILVIYNILINNFMIYDKIKYIFIICKRN